LLWHVLLAAGAALTLLTLGFHLLSIGLRRAASLPWSSQPPPALLTQLNPDLAIAEAIPAP
jgi:hypothetical protein